MASVEADVVVIGDGPAGSALAAALRRRDVEVTLVGPDATWEATYTTWVDDIDDLDLLAGAEPWAHQFDRIIVRFARAHVIDRAYGVIDNDALRAHLRAGVHHVVGIVAAETDVTARLVVDATGWPSKLAAEIGVTATRTSDAAGWQTAFGVVLAGAPDGPLGQATMMDFSDPGIAIVGRESVPTFAYSLPVTGGWLVEETVLTASPPVDPDALRPLLAMRLGVTVDEMLEAAVSTEAVRIPMGVPPPDPRPDPHEAGLVRFGTAAGMVHPATGYSVASALRAADRVASAITSELERSSGGTPIDLDLIRRSVWTTSERRTRQLHDYGHDVLLGLDRAGVQRFFDAFFDLPTETWSRYLRIDTPPSRLAGVMAAMFTTAPWTLRARLLTGDPRRFVRMLRPPAGFPMSVARRAPTRSRRRSRR